MSESFARVSNRPALWQPKGAVRARLMSSAASVSRSNGLTVPIVDCRFMKEEGTAHVCHYDGEEGALFKRGAEAFDASTHKQYALLWRMNVSSA